MQIDGEISGIKYRRFLKSNLPNVALGNFDVNQIPSSCVVTNGENSFAVSRWVSPKRTRSYPYERVFNTFSITKRITIIPIVKDEGVSGDRDFLQWDTIALMSLLDVYVILAFYDDAEKHHSRSGKITKQQFDNDFVSAKIREIGNYFSSALHWNLHELQNIGAVLEKVKISHRKIAAKTNVDLHNEKGLNNFAQNLDGDLSNFMESSRLKAQSAQNREFLTLQPKEILSTATKARITISNYLGGKYFFTVDEVEIIANKVFLIECKHSKSAKLPSVGDIKDGLLKMMLYANLEDVTVDNMTFESKAVLNLTAAKMSGAISSNSPKIARNEFFRVNKYSSNQILFLRQLFIEARYNGFVVKLKGENDS